MKNLLKNTRIILLFALIHFLVLTSFAQTNISSPYSRYGLGQLHTNSNFRLGAMGGMGLAVKKNDLINISNPATYAGFDSTSFLFEGGVRGIVSQLSNANESVITNNLSINYLLFGFPLGKRFSASFGLLPLSNMGYRFADSDSLNNIGDINYSYEGEGGFNKAFIGTAVKITPNFSLGVNASYIFGALKKTRTITFPEVANIYSVRHVDATIAGDIVFDYGLFYEKSLQNDYSIAFGITGANPAKLNATQNVLIESFSGVNYGLIHVKDTIENSTHKGHLAMPMAYGAGVVLKKSNSWLVGADYRFQEWSTFSSFGVNDSLKNSMQLALGAEFNPSYTLSSSVWKKSTYRFGVRYAQTYLELKNSRLQDYGISFGMGIPLQRSRTAMNVGIEVGRKGTTENNLVRETYGMLTFSLSIYERWFVRRKYD